MRVAATFILGALVVCSTPAPVRAQGGRGSDLAVRIQASEDREAIRALWAAYGRTLDARDFAAFGQLFARDGEFVAGAGATAKGPAAVGALLEKLIGTNFPDSKGRNFHLYFNETIDVQGDRATGVSKGGFVMANAANNRVEFLQLATYVDELVREDGRWKFKRREIQGNIPVPRAASR
jgi:uncharacterized protein (TIGR02246 family)